MGCQVMIEGPGHIPMHLVKMNIEKERELCHDAPFYVPRATRDRHRNRVTTTSPAPSAARATCGRSRREHVVATSRRKNTWAYPTRTTCAGRDRVQDRGARRRHRSRSENVRDRDNALSKARFEFDWNQQFALSLDPETARKMHDETLPQEVLQEREVLFDVRAEVLLNAESRRTCAKFAAEAKKLSLELATV